MSANNTTVFVDGMTCDGCVNRLQKVLERNPVIDRADVTLSPGKAVIQHSLSDVSAIDEIVKKAGFSVVNKE